MCCPKVTFTEYEWCSLGKLYCIFLRLLTNRLNRFFQQALAPKEKDSMDSIGGGVDDEINATAEVRYW